MAKKMVLVDPRLISHSPAPVPEPVPDVLRRLDGDMESIMRNQSLHVSEKVARYNEVLNDYLNKTREYRDLQSHGPALTQRASLVTSPGNGPTSVSNGETDKGLDDGVYIDMIPKSYRGKATRLLKFLKQVPEVSWTDRGELKVGGHVYSRSHIVDLVNTTVKPTLKKGSAGLRPAGWEVFSQILSNSNVPQDLLSSTVKRELSFSHRGRRRIGSLQPSPSSSSEGDEAGIAVTELQSRSRHTRRGKRAYKTALRWSPLVMGRKSRAN